MLIYQPVHQYSHTFVFLIKQTYRYTLFLRHISFQLCQECIRFALADKIALLWLQMGILRFEDFLAIDPE